MLVKMGCVHRNINGGPLQSASQDIFSTNYVGPEVTIRPYYTHAVLYKAIFNGLSGLKLCQYCSWKRKGQNRSQLYCRYKGPLYQGYYFMVVVHGALLSVKTHLRPDRVIIFD